MLNAHYPQEANGYPQNSKSAREKPSQVLGLGLSYVVGNKVSSFLRVVLSCGSWSTAFTGPVMHTILIRFDKDHGLITGDDAYMDAFEEVF